MLWIELFPFDYPRLIRMHCRDRQDTIETLQIFYRLISSDALKRAGNE